MQYNNIIIVLILLLVSLYFLCNIDNKKENFESKYIANEHIYQGKRRDGYDLLDDSLFTKVITYNNDDDPYECGSKLGIEKCLENCPGRCIEFGITGIGYCFPPDKE
jgi:hypothetical protein